MKIWSKKKRYLWLTDTHLYPWDIKNLINYIHSYNPQGVFLTGDISHSSSMFLFTIEKLAKIKIPIYFVYGNHDVWLSSFSNLKNNIIDLQNKYNNLKWLTDQPIISLNKNSALIGEEGWYCGGIGNSNYIKYTFDWFMIEELRQLFSWKNRLEYFVYLSEISSINLSIKLKNALENHNKVYLLTHFPPWHEMGNYSNWISKKFWTPYNFNLILGKELEKVMLNYPDKKLMVYCGHTHSESSAYISDNIECRVGKPRHLGPEIEIIYE